MKAWITRALPEGFVEAVRDLRALPGGARLAWLRACIGRNTRTAAALHRLATLPASPFVVFICHGNIYRSPLAEAALGRLATSLPAVPLRIASAGLHERGGRPAPSDAQRIAAEFGVSLQGHVSRSLDASEMAAADVLVVMDRRNEALVRARFPAQAHKVLLLGALDPLSRGAGERIADPYGRGDEAIRDAYAAILRAVGRLHDLIAHGHHAQPAVGRLKRIVRRIVMTPALRPLWLSFTEDAAAILMLHRFDDRDLGVTGHSPDQLASHLEYLRAHDYHISSLDALVGRLLCGEPPPPRTVVFTVDDGYADFARVGAAIFAKYDCPATAFLTTGLVDGDTWLWYDKVKHLMGHDREGELRFAIGDREEHVRWRSPVERHRRTWELINRLKQVPTELVEACVVSLAAARGTSVPTNPPSQFAAMSWDDVRFWGTRGMMFGAHSRTHPILSRSSDAQSRAEITESWARVRANTPQASGVFAYPNGMPADFGPREREYVLAAGLVGAVTSSGGHCALSHVRRDRFAIPRIPYSEDLGDVRQSLAGIGRVKAMIRGDAA